MTELFPGMRVRLRAPTWGLTLRKDTGTIKSRFEDDEGYYIVILDEPGIYDHGTERAFEMHEVVEASDNMEILPD